jgi:hypothetical protein
VINGQVGIDQFRYVFLDGRMATPGTDPPEGVPAKILHIDAGDFVIDIPFRAEHWDTFQQMVEKTGPVRTVQAVSADALKAIPSIEEIIGNGRGG